MMKKWTFFRLELSSVKYVQCLYFYSYAYLYFVFASFDIHLF